MRFFKYVIDGYVIGCGKGNMGEQITGAEYNNILAAIKIKPPRTETTDWRLRTDLTWEEYTIDPPSTEHEVDDSEAFDSAELGRTYTETNIPIENETDVGDKL